MPFSRYVPVWSNFPGAPGFTVLSFFGDVGSSAAANALAGHTKGFFDALTARIPSGITITYPAEVTRHSDDGTLVGVTAVTQIPVATVMAGTGSYAGPVGARVNWETGSIVAGRRLRGRTYLVPLNVGSYDATGTLLSTALTAIQDAASAFVVATSGTVHPLAVWSQPRVSNPTGAVAAVIAAQVPDEAAVMRSRRD